MFMVAISTIPSHGKFMAAMVLLKLALPPRWSSIFGSTAVTGMARHPRVYTMGIQLPQ
jgi:hypothetical protein